MDSSKVEYNRVNRPVAEAESYYTRLSGIYDLLAASEKRFVKQGLQLLDPQPGEKILEIGFGTGFAQERLLRILKHGLSVGIDLSSGMTQVARRNLIKAGFRDQLALVQNDSLPLPFQTGSFDGVFSSFALELFDSPLIPAVLQEVHRVLKPAGRFCIVSLSKDKPLPLMGQIYERMHIRYPQLLDCRPIPVLQIMDEGRFTIQRSIQAKMWGLPVIHVEAKRA